jgi:hypothetical protein
MEIGDEDYGKQQGKERGMVLSGLRRSGFPFQTVITHAVMAETPNGWAVHRTEYPWQAAGGNEARFLDLIAVKAGFFLAVECKKRRDDVLTFLCPVGVATTTGRNAERFTCLHMKREAAAYGGLEVYPEERMLRPESTESEFCVAGTGEQERALEPDAAFVVRAADAFAEFIRMNEKQRGALPIDSQLVLPVIVTNAPLYSVRYQPSEVSLKTGEFPELPGEIEREQCVRFRKSFTVDARYDIAERSVFVVNAAHFRDFLKQLQRIPAE